MEEMPPASPGGSSTASPSRIRALGPRLGLGAAGLLLCAVPVLAPAPWASLAVGLVLVALTAAVARVASWPWLVGHWLVVSAAYAVATLGADRLDAGTVTVLVGAGLAAGLLTSWSASRARAGSVHDAASGVLAPSGLDLVAGRLYAWSQRHAQPVGVAVVQVQRARAAPPLTQLVDGWTARLRGEDLLARLRGSTFAVVLPGASPDGAATVCRRLTEVAGPGWRTTGWGVAAWGPAEDLDEVLAEATQEMRRQRRHGRADPSDTG
ncbi:MAG: hypothetical protein R2737_16180 [Candidatus Nanopelagicales bacterium]